MPCTHAPSQREKQHSVRIREVHPTPGGAPGEGKARRVRLARVGWGRPHLMHGRGVAERRRADEARQAAEDEATSARAYARAADARAQELEAEMESVRGIAAEREGALAAQAARAQQEARDAAAAGDEEAEKGAAMLAHAERQLKTWQEAAARHEATVQLLSRGVQERDARAADLEAQLTVARAAAARADDAHARAEEAAARRAEDLRAEIARMAAALQSSVGERDDAASEARARADAAQSEVRVLQERLAALEAAGCARCCDMDSRLAAQQQRAEAAQRGADRHAPPRAPACSHVQPGRARLIAARGERAAARRRRCCSCGAQSRR